MANGVTRLVGEEGKAFLGPLWTCWKAKEWFLILIYLRSKRRRCLPPIFFHLLPFHLASNTKWQYRGNSKICHSQTSFEKFSAVFTCQRIAKMLVNCNTPFRWKTLLNRYGMFEVELKEIFPGRHWNTIFVAYSRTQFWFATVKVLFKVI